MNILTNNETVSDVCNDFTARLEGIQKKAQKVLDTQADKIEKAIALQNAADLEFSQANTAIANIRKMFGA